MHVYYTIYVVITQDHYQRLGLLCHWSAESGTSLDLESRVAITYLGDRNLAFAEWTSCSVDYIK